MTTHTDYAWQQRLAAVMPDNFMSNISGNFEPVAGILNNMMNMIGRTVIDSVDNPYNPFSDYTQAVMDYGDTIQNYKTKFVQGQVYDPEAVDVFAQNKSEPIAQYFKYNDKIQYPITIFDDQLKLAFTGQERFGDFISAQVDSLYESDGLDKYFKWKKFMSNTDHFGSMIEVTEDAVTDPKSYGERLLWEFKDLTTKFKQPNIEYNTLNDLAISSNVDIIMRASDKNIIDQKVLAGVFNLNKLDIDARFKYVDDFATAEDSKGVTSGREILAIICDRRTFGYTPRTPVATSIYNPKALATNYFFTVQGIYQMARFRNCVALYKSPVEVKHSVKVGVDPEGGGSASSDVNVASEGETVNLTAIASEGYTFQGWSVESGGVEITDPTELTASFTMGTQNVEIIARFTDH